VDRSPLSREPRIAPAELITGLSCVRCEDLRAGDAAALFVSWPTRRSSRTTYASHPKRDARCRWRHVIPAPAQTGLDKATPLKRSDAMKETLAKEFPTPARPTVAALRRLRPFAETARKAASQMRTGIDYISSKPTFAIRSSRIGRLCPPVVARYTTLWHDQRSRYDRSGRMT